MFEVQLSTTPLIILRMVSIIQQGPNVNKIRLCSSILNATNMVKYNWETVLVPFQQFTKHPSNILFHFIRNQENISSTLTWEESQINSMSSKGCVDCLETNLKTKARHHS